MLEIRNANPNIKRILEMSGILKIIPMKEEKTVARVGGKNE